MNLKKISLVAVFAVMLFAVLLIPSFAAGNMDYANDAPGGTVTSADEFVAALGSENAVKVSETEIKLKNSIVLQKTIEITNGRYTLKSQGCIIYRGFEKGALFFLNGSSLSQRPSLSLGVASTAMIEEGVEPNLTIDGCKDIYPKADGSLIMLKGGATLNVYGSTLLTNASNTGMGGAVYAELGEHSEVDYSTPLEPTVLLRNCKIEKCSADIAGGAVAFVGCYDGFNVGSLTVENVSFPANTSVNETGTGAGGSIYALGGTVNVATATFTENIADNGAAVYIASEGRMSNITAEYNTAKVSGGVVYVGATNEVDGEVSIENLVAHQNKSEGNGGVITNEGILLGLSLYCTQNECALNGGGIYNTGVFEMKEGSFMNNDAGVSGGGAYCKGEKSVFILSGGEINSNESPFAGAIYSEGAVEINGGAVGRNDSAEPHLVLKGKVVFGKNASVLGSNTIGLCITEDQNGNENIPYIELTGASTVLDYMYVGFFREKTDKDGIVTGYKMANKSGRSVFVGTEEDIKNTEKWYIAYYRGPLSYVINEDGTLSPRFIHLPIWAWFIIVPALGAGGFFGYKKIKPLIKNKKAK
ncbi:MAG: hypothetical protein E7634_07700 [Ruminococcaceae bacterium]|nr:hypothetical protein [Oscillospiraceae bacterium]